MLIYLHSGSLFEPSTHTLHEAFAPLFLLSEKRPTVCVALQMVRQQARRRISDPKQMTLQQRSPLQAPQAAAWATLTRASAARQVFSLLFSLTVQEMCLRSS